MLPILCKIGPFNVYSYGAMVAIGFAIAVFFIHRRASIFGLDRDKITDLLVLILISGVLGARVFYIILEHDYFSAHPLEIFNLSRGGLVLYGGFISALAVSIWFAVKNHMNFWIVVDLVAPYVALAQAFGRIGCYLNGCCYGVKAAPGFIFGEFHPVQIYSAILLFCIFVILLFWQYHRRFAGEIFLGYCMLYSVKRFFIEFLRGDNPKIFLGLTVSQLISIAIFIAAILFFKIRMDICKTEKYSRSK